MPRSSIPLRIHARRRDRHGRGLRGPIIPFNVPSWRTRADKFDDILTTDLAHFRSALGKEMERIDFAVLDVPDSEPAPWESGIPMARFLPFEHPAKVTGRIIFYRMPMLHAARRSPNPRLFLHDIVTQQLASAIGCHPEDIDYLR